MILVGQKDKTQAVERPPGDVHLRLVAVDVINGSLNGGDFLSFFVRNLSIKLFFQSHYQLNGVKRIRAQVFNERSIVGNFFLLNAQLFADNFLYAQDVAKLSVVRERKLKVSSKKAKIDGGLLLIGKNSDKNLSFSALLAEDRELMQAEIASVIFG